MAQSIIENGESGLAVRTALNNMFTELYAAAAPSAPIVIEAMAGNTNVAVSAGVLINNIYITQQTGSVTLRIGITPNGEELLSDTEIDVFQAVMAQQYFKTAGTLYFTFSGGAGTLNVYIFYINGLV